MEILVSGLSHGFLSVGFIPNHILPKRQWKLCPEIDISIQYIGKQQFKTKTTKSVCVAILQRLGLGVYRQLSHLRSAIRSSNSWYYLWNVPKFVH